MRTSTSFAALALGLSIIGGAAADAQTATQAPAKAPAEAPATTPAAAAGAGAAAATSGGDGAAPAAQTPAADAGAGAGAAAATSGTAAPAPDAAPAQQQDVKVAEVGGKKALPNGMDLTPDYEENGRWYNADGIPVPNIAEDGTVDYSTFSGYRRYHAECHVCHGPDGEGSSYAPALKNSVLQMDYYAFQEIVASGKQNVSNSANQVMPAFGTNRNVWCYIDDIYVYLLAHGTEMIPRGRPAKRADKPAAFTEQEDACMAG